MMAYLDPVGRVGAARPFTPFTPVLTLNGSAGEFTPLQWRVIRLARGDSLSSLREETKIGEFLRFIFGWAPERPLADARLEALRRMTVMSWHRGYNVPSAEIEAFLAAGYTIAHYEALLAHIGQARTNSTPGVQA